MPIEGVFDCCFLECVLCFFFSRLFADGDDACIPAEFSFVFESGDGMNIGNEVAGKEGSNTRDGCNKSVFCMPLCFRVSNECVASLVFFSRYW